MSVIVGAVAGGVRTAVFVIQLIRGKTMAIDGYGTSGRIWRAVRHHDLLGSGVRLKQLAAVCIDAISSRAEAALRDLCAAAQAEIALHGESVVTFVAAGTLDGNAAAGGQVDLMDAGGGSAFIPLHNQCLIVGGGQGYLGIAGDLHKAGLVGAVTVEQQECRACGAGCHRSAGDGDAVVPGDDAEALACGRGDVHRAVADVHIRKGCVMSLGKGDDAIVRIRHGDGAAGD